MACWSAWAKRKLLVAAHQWEAIPQLAPASSERKRSIPPTQTRLASAGSTAMTLSYQPWLKNWFGPQKPQSLKKENKVFVSRTVLSLVGLVLRTWAVQVVPLSMERKTPCSPSSKLEPACVLAATA